MPAQTGRPSDRIALASTEKRWAIAVGALTGDPAVAETALRTVIERLTARRARCSPAPPCSPPGGPGGSPSALPDALGSAASDRIIFAVVSTGGQAVARRPRTPADFAALTAEERITHALRGLDDCGDLRPTAGSLRRAFESLEQVLAEPDVAFLIEDRIDRIETMDDADLDALASRIGVLKDRVQDLAPFIEALTNLEEAMQSVCYEVRSAQEDRRMSRAVELAENAAAIQRYREGVRDSVTFEDIARGRVPGIDHLSVLDLPLATERGEPLVITHADFESVSSPRQPATTVADLRKAVRGQRTHAGSDARRVITVFTGTGRRRSIEMARVRVPRRMLAELAVAQAQPAKKVA